MTGNTYTLRMQAAGAEAAGDPVMLPPQMVRALADLIDAAEEVWRCKRCNGGGLIAPGGCCQTCAGDGLRVEWDDDGSDLRPLIDALAALDQEAPT